MKFGRMKKYRAESSFVKKVTIAYIRVSLKAIYEQKLRIEKYAQEI